MIVRMAKVQVLGPRRVLPAALQVLHSQGVLQIRSLPDGPGTPDADPAWLRVIPLAGGEQAAERALEEVAGRLRDLLLLLPATDSPTPDPISGEADGLPDEVTAPDVLSRLAALETDVRTLSDRRAALEAEQDLTARYERLFTALAPLRPALQEGTQVTTLGILLRRDRTEILRLLEQEVGRITRGACVLTFRELDREQIGLLLTVPHAAAAEVSRLLFERGITEIRLPGQYVGQPLVDALLLLARRSQELPAEIHEVAARLRAISARWHRPLTQALRVTRDHLTRLAAMARCGETEHIFVVSGWVPEESCGRLSAELEAAFEGRVILVEHMAGAADGDEVPVLLRNPPYVRAFELLVGFLALPRYGSIDPTPFMAVFFPVFFGLMLGDVGFGGLALVLVLLARIKGWGGEMGRQLTAIALACSVSAIGFGLLFGELFGELGEPLGLHPLLFDRRQAALSFLGLALAFGAVHIVLGVGLAFWSAFRRGHWREALARATTLSLILTALAAGLARVGYLPAAAGQPALLALSLLLVAAVVFGGGRAPLEMMNTLGNILSYARLMALGTASAMLADVANRMAEIFTPVVVGVTAAIVLHGVNFAMGLFSPTIQALRLHYVEFFDKFFEGGGKPYEPFALTT